MRKGDFQPRKMTIERVFAKESINQLGVHGAFFGNPINKVYADRRAVASDEWDSCPKEPCCPPPDRAEYAGS
jgi:hypothetical protein